MASVWGLHRDREKMGIATSVIRKYFIYISFLTLGSPVIFYLFFAFWINIKNLYSKI